MNNKIKVIGILMLAGFSFFYTNKVTSIIKKTDPIMKQIDDYKKEVYVSKIDPIIINDEYITGINGCIVNEEDSYNKMKNVGEFKEELIVMKEDYIKDINDKYIISGNKKNRNVSIILLDLNKKTDNFIRKNNIKVNYFLDGKKIEDDIDKLIDINKYSKIYSYGRNGEYLSKYISYDNSIINLSFNNESSYCLLKEKNKSQLNLCKSNNMKSIKGNIIKEDILLSTKEQLKNGNIFIFDSNDYTDIIMSIKYILSKGYNIIFLDELLDEKNNCN